MQDIEKGNMVEQKEAEPEHAKRSSNLSSPTHSTVRAPICQIGTLTLVYLIFSVISFCFKLRFLFVVSPTEISIWRMIFFSFFPFALNIQGLIINVILLLFCSTFFEKKFGTIGFLFKLELFKLLFLVIVVAIYQFLNYLVPSHIHENSFVLDNFSVIFMVLISEEAFDKPNDTSTLPIANIKIKNVYITLTSN